MQPHNHADRHIQNHIQEHIHTHMLSTDNPLAKPEPHNTHTQMCMHTYIHIQGNIRGDSTLAKPEAHISPHAFIYAHIQPHIHADAHIQTLMLESTNRRVYTVYRN